jgi:zinc protease
MKEDLIRVQPPVVPAGNISIPEASHLSLPNGADVFLLEAGTGDVVRIEFIFHAGQIKEYLPLLSSTTNLMLQEGSENYTSSELHALLDFYGAFIHLYSDKDRAGLVVFSLNRHVAKIMELSREILFRPVFPGEELRALMRKRLQWFRINREKMQNLAMDNFFEMIFGKKHQYGRRVKEEDFAKIFPVMLTDFHSAFYRPEEMTIIVSGKIPAGTRQILENEFGNLSSPEVYREEFSTTIMGSGRHKKHIEKPGSVQTAIRIGSPTINKRHPDYPGLKVTDTILGGYFGSRLMRNIREEKGYTYGIRSGISSLDLSGYKVISTEVGSMYLKNSLDEIYKEIRKLQTEFTAKEELDSVRNYMLGEMIRIFDGPFSLAESFKSAWEFGLGSSYYYNFIEKIRTIDGDEIKSLASTYYNIDDLYQVTSGSKMNE